jgi:hypothetical protein
MVRCCGVRYAFWTAPKGRFSVPGAILARQLRSRTAHADHVSDI